MKIIINLSYYSSRLFLLQRRNCQNIITFIIKIIKRTHFQSIEQKLQINPLQPTSMDSQNRAEYLLKIEEIRQRIQTKQSSDRQTRSNAYSKTSLGQNSSSISKIDPLRIAEDLSKRRPLESVQNKANQFQERVKELDSVSDRIKTLLAHKRTPTTHIENIGKTADLTVKNEKLTSLFQKEILFSESKVGQGTFGELRSKEIPYKIKDRPSYNLPNQSSFKYSSQQESASSQYPTLSQNKTSVKQQLSMTQQQTSSQFDIQSYKKRFIKEASGAQKEKFNDYSTTQPIISPLTTKTAMNQKKESLQSKKQQNKPIRNVQSSSNAPQTSKLLQIISKQIQLQTKLRANKEKFDAFRAQNKLSLLKQELTKRRITFSEKQLDQWVKIEEEEFDPFLSLVFTRDFNFEELINSLVQAKNHWQQKVRRCVQGEALKKEEFKIKEGQGFRKAIFLQDFVCFINIQTDSLFKNRDLFSLFKHFMLLQSPQIGSEHKINPQTFFNYVSK